MKINNIKLFQVNLQQGFLLHDENIIGVYSNHLKVIVFEVPFSQRDEFELPKEIADYDLIFGRTDAFSIQCWTNDGYKTVESIVNNIKSIIQVKVVSVSSNTNSFGLHGVIIMNKAGITYQIGIGSLYKPKKGQILQAIMNRGGELFEINNISYEIPQRLPDAPQNVIDEVWK